MKKLFLAAIVITILNDAEILAQVEKTADVKYTTIGEARLGGSPFASLEFRVEGKDTVFLLNFRNAEYREITDYENVIFRNTGTTIDDLYKILLETLSKEKGKETRFTLGDDRMLAKVISTGKWVSIYRLSNGSFFSLSRKFLAKLFNKKE